MPDTAISNISTWLDKIKAHDGFTIEPNADVKYISAENIVLLATKPNLSDADLSNAAAIGVVSAISVAQQKQIQKIFEIGSRYGTTFTGKTMGSININRILYDGPNLLKFFYTANIKDKNFDYPTITPGAKISEGNDIDKGISNWWMNLESDIFNHPFGLIMLMYPEAGSNATAYGATLFTKCYVTGHSLRLTGGDVLVQEGVSLQFSRALPISVSSSTSNSSA